MSAITISGKRYANGIRSHSSEPSSGSSRVSQWRWIIARMSAIRRGVKARCAMRRRRSWSSPSVRLTWRPWKAATRSNASCASGGSELRIASARVPSKKPRRLP